jgi:hypothetical protein
MARVCTKRSFVLNGKTVITKMQRLSASDPVRTFRQNGNRGTSPITSSPITSVPYFLETYRYRNLHHRLRLTRCT